MRRFTTIFQPLFAQHGIAKSILFLVLSVSILVVSIIYFALSFGRPFMGVKLSIEDDVWVVQSVDLNGSAGQVGVQPGDIPLEINGENAATYLDRFRIVGLVSGLSIESITVADETGNVITATIEGASLSSDSYIEFYSLLFVTIVFWGMGFYTFFRRPENHAAFVFCLSGLAFGLLISTTIAKDCLIPGALWLASILTIIGPWMLLHFFLVLPDNQTWYQGKFRILLVYLIPVTSVILLATAGTSLGLTYPWFYTLRTFEIGLAIVGIVVVVVLNFYRAPSLKIRQQMKIILLCSLVAVIPLLLFFTVPVLIWKQAVIPPGMSVLFIGVLPLGMGYAVVTQRLMDIDVVIRRGVIYGIVTIIMVALLSTSIFWLLVSSNPLSDGEKFLIALLLSVVAVVLFGPVKGRIEILVDRLFYKDRYDYRRIIQNLNTSLNNMRESYEMSRLIVGTVVHTLNLAGGCILTRDQSDELVISATQGLYNMPEKRDEFMELSGARGREIEFPNPAPADHPDIAYLIPLVAAENEVGLLFIANKVSRQDFSSDDLMLLDGIASTAALSLHRALLIHEVSLRDTFVSIASHELRTPLTAVIGYADLLMRRDPPSETKNQWLGIISESGDRMSSMLDDLLNVSRIQSGRITFKKDRTNSSELLEERAEFMRETTRNHEIVLDTGAEIPDINVDKEKLGQIIDNLLNNAIKYSPDGGRITVSNRYDRVRREVLLSVADEGIGISPEDRNLLFTTFHRIQRPETRNIPGTGLGLYIAKEWTESMGGRISLESELNEGSTFMLAFPVADNQ